MECRRCKLPIQERRSALGYTTCRVCSEVVGSQIIRTVAPMHKSNYVLVSNRADLAGINSKGGYHA